MTGRRILVADDDRAMAATLADVLSLHGWEPVTAFDGAEAVAIAAAGSVDVVLMDVRMPRLDGVAALRAMKADHPGLRVVLMTAFAASHLLEEARDHGVIDVLRKPVEPPQLIRLLEELLQRRRSVLVVDDQPDFLGTLCTLLRERGLLAIEARSLAEGLARMATEKPAAVLVDLRLGAADTPAGIRAMRAMNPETLLVLYSGHPEELSDTLGAQPDGFVDASFTKPLPLEELLGVLDDRGH